MTNPQSIVAEHKPSSLDDIVASTRAMSQNLAYELHTKIKDKESVLTRQLLTPLQTFVYAMLNELGWYTFPNATGEEATRAVCGDIYDDLLLLEGHLKAQRDKLEREYGTAVNISAATRMKYDQSAHKSTLLSQELEKIAEGISLARDGQVAYQRSNSETDNLLFANSVNAVALLEARHTSLKTEQQNLVQATSSQKRGAAHAVVIEESLRINYENVDITYGNVKHTRKMLNGALHSAMGVSSHPLLTQAMQHVTLAQAVLDQAQSLAKSMSGYLHDNS